MRFRREQLNSKFIFGNSTECSERLNFRKEEKVMSEKNLKIYKKKRDVVGQT